MPSILLGLVIGGLQINLTTERKAHTFNLRAQHVFVGELSDE